MVEAEDVVDVGPELAGEVLGVERRIGGARRTVEPREVGERERGWFGGPCLSGDCRERQEKSEDRTRNVISHAVTSSAGSVALNGARLAFMKYSRRTDLPLRCLY